MSRLPVHIAIIMDGNGRWAKSKGLPRLVGHQEGVRTVQKITRACGELGIKHLTLYTFSSENWNRPRTEVKALMELFVKSLHKEIKNLMENNVRLTAIGNFDTLPGKVAEELKEGIVQTSGNSGLNLNLAFNYGSHEEIVQAVRSISEKCMLGEIRPEQIDAKLISSHLYTRDIPDPDLLIRTGGEYRISNFLLWQLAYTEIFITDTYWPSFNKEKLHNAIADFQKRERRFGKISEQVES